MTRFFKYIFKIALFWILFFALHRLLFMIFNLGYAGDAGFGSLLASYAVGLRLDLSFSGYILLLTCVMQLITLPIFRRFEFTHLHWLHYVIIPVFMALMFANTNLYSYWGRHLDGEALGFLATPMVILASLRWWEVIMFFVLLISASLGTILIYNKWMKSGEEKIVSKMQPLTLAMAAFITLFTGALMIIPIRGSFGVAPINTGVAYFSSHMFANHSAINPLWNLFYSLKRLDATTRHYRFMDQDKAEELFNKMMHQSGETQTLINQPQPDVVVILLESFSAQVIGSMGGESVTPNFDSLVPKGVLFNNIYAASDRSDKGLVAALAGYQVMPAYSIMQYPAKSQSLSFLPNKLKQAGYNDLTYMYGGDIGFKGMNSFVTLSGFEKVITINDFPRSTHGQKWGVHDEYTFERLIEEMLAAQSPYFQFYFTLSSHEPFDVPMDRVYDDPYLNSVFYTDQCLGDFFRRVKSKGLWDNTLFILIADHGVPGPARATSQMIERYHIPMLWTGGAMAVTDTIISTIGSQTDMVSTLLNQLQLDASEFPFSKNLLAEEVEEFAFFTYPDAFGLITADLYKVYDNNAGRYIVFEGEASAVDSLKGKAYLQVLSLDHLNR
ncbi:LTA synthase family protein [Natronoflexus pectinivorans]|uniref:Phosphoglycerol transferase MdoB-like AlkP superfamily enzyme n=1 Tax=Natronoflexus pectinivorans TaxID=682526 RepID=A0A4R2GNM4_9BACT|nr:alkaline phosphatase family protein [Natronoflexus pectinivorans]TCO10922.1 phosphoglycerol transferase MdoB-like AlkP superfamily enzyme [Natronoflexus pectinivorans]